jgi:hypothetical protein
MVDSGVRTPVRFLFAKNIATTLLSAQIVSIWSAFFQKPCLARTSAGSIPAASTRNRSKTVSCKNDRPRRTPVLAGFFAYGFRTSAPRRHPVLPSVSGFSRSLLSFFRTIKSRSPEDGKNPWQHVPGAASKALIDLFAMLSFLSAGASAWASGPLFTERHRWLHCRISS